MLCVTRLKNLGTSFRLQRPEFGPLEADARDWRLLA